MLCFETWDKEYEKTMGAENLHKPEDENLKTTTHN